MFDGEVANISKHLFLIIIPDFRKSLICPKISLISLALLHTATCISPNDLVRCFFFFFLPNNYWYFFWFLHENKILWIQISIVLTLVLLNPDIPCFANNVDPDQLASEEANWSGSALFVIQYVNLYQQSVLSNLIGWKLEVGMAF